MKAGIRQLSPVLVSNSAAVQFTTLPSVITYRGRRMSFFGIYSEATMEEGHYCSDAGAVRTRCEGLDFKVRI